MLTVAFAMQAGLPSGLFGAAELKRIRAVAAGRPPSSPVRWQSQETMA